jgi:hypothetical protein
MPPWVPDFCNTPLLCAIASPFFLYLQYCVDSVQNCLLPWNKLSEVKYFLQIIIRDAERIVWWRLGRVNDTTFQLWALLNDVLDRRFPVHARWEDQHPLVLDFRRCFQTEDKRSSRVADIDVTRRWEGPVGLEQTVDELVGSQVPLSRALDDLVTGSVWTIEE